MSNKREIMELFISTTQNRQQCMPPQTVYHTFLIIVATILNQFHTGAAVNLQLISIIKRITVQSPLRCNNFAHKWCIHYCYDTHNSSFCLKKQNYHDLQFHFV